MNRNYSQPFKWYSLRYTSYHYEFVFNTQNPIKKNKSSFSFIPSYPYLNVKNKKANP